MKLVPIETFKKQIRHISDEKLRSRIEFCNIHQLSDYEEALHDEAIRRIKGA